MMRTKWLTASALLLAALVLAAVEMAPSHRELATLFPDGAQLYLEAHDLHVLLRDWDTSAQKRTWLAGDNYAAFSRSRLFQRLSQAQDEFSTAASIPADSALLASIAGAESALAIYDIGNLEFVYVTRMTQAQAESTPLWHVHDKFELRAEGGAQFYVRGDQQSGRTAAFAIRDGWLILATRADLVAEVLDRIANANTRSIVGETWYADALKLAATPAQDLRMVLNLEKIVPSPYFRSYWIQRNITEMSQYRAALCDLRRTSDVYVEQRVLLRKPGLHATSSGDVQPLLSLAPASAVFASAQASPTPSRILAELRENLLELRSTPSRSLSSAPRSLSMEEAGSVGALEERIDVAPALAIAPDPYQSLVSVLDAARPRALLLVYQTHAESGEALGHIDQAVVLEASAWHQDEVQQAITSALQPNLTVAQLGIGWTSHTWLGSSYQVLNRSDAPITLALAIRGERLFLATSESLLQSLLSADRQMAATSTSGITYAAVFHHSLSERKSFSTLVQHLDTASHGGSPQTTIDSVGASVSTDGQTPIFFSGNIASLSQMFSSVTRQIIEERDEGAQVRQSIRYEWQRP